MNAASVISAAMRNRGRARNASKVDDGSKKMPLSVSAVVIDGPVGVVDAGARGGALNAVLWDSLIAGALRFDVSEEDGQAQGRQTEAPAPESGKACSIGPFYVSRAAEVSTARRQRAASAQ